MKIIIDLRVYNWTGIGRVAKGYAKYLPDARSKTSFVYILNPGQADEISFPNVKKEYIPYKTFDLREHLAIWNVIRKHNDAKVFHALHFNIPFYIPPGIKLVSNIYDLAYEYTNDAFRTVFHKIYYKIFFKRTLERSDKIISQSDFTKQDLNKYYNHSTSEVIYPGFNAEEWKSKKLIPSKEYKNILEDDYILFVGINHPRKNLKLLVEVFSEILLNNPQLTCKLIIVGKNEDKRYNISKDILRRKMGDKIKLLGFVNDETLKILYNNAMIYIIPSLIESGYSYPALEAASYGVPVMANEYDMQGFGRNALRYFNATDKIDFNFKLEEFIINQQLRSDYSQRALKWSNSYQWNNYISKLNNIYNLFIND